MAHGVLALKALLVGSLFVAVVGLCSSFGVLAGKTFLAKRGFDPRTLGLWALCASSAPLCSYSMKKPW